MDVIALHRGGFATAVAPLGTALTAGPLSTIQPEEGQARHSETQLQELWRLSPEPVLCFDGDSAGQRAALRALNRALPLLKPGRSLRFAVLPPGEDPDSLIRARGADSFAEVLAAARPLVEVLWQSELAERPIDTPERRADLKSRLERRARDIADSEVQREYRRVLTDRYYELTRGGQDFRQGRDFRDRESRSGPRRFQPLRVEAPPPPPIPGRAHRQIFLGLLLRHPALIGDWVEELAEIEMPEPDLDRLQHEILQNCEAFAGLDAERLEQHLGSCGFADAVGALARAIAAHAGFATGGEDDPEVIRNGLSETLVLLRAQAPGDLDAAEHAFAADASDENWQRLKALKEREAEDGPVGGLNW
jgi:DNA primase